MDLSEKELSVIQDLLNEEELLVKKFQMLAEHSQDETINLLLYIYVKKLIWFKRKNVNP